MAFNKKLRLPTPPIPLELVEYLEHVYRNRLPLDVNTPRAEICAQIGEQRVVQHLRSRFEKQQDNVLES